MAGGSQNQIDMMYDDVQQISIIDETINLDNTATGASIVSSSNSGNRRLKIKVNLLLVQ